MFIVFSEDFQQKNVMVFVISFVEPLFLCLPTLLKGEDETLLAITLIS